MKDCGKRYAEKEEKRGKGTAYENDCHRRSGFIGSNFIYYELEHGDDQILCLDKLTYAGDLETLEKAEKDPRFSFIRGDIADRKFVYDLFEKEKPDVVVNFAAESHVDRSIVHPDVFLNTNILGTGVLLDACRIYGIHRFHQVSTDEVYGDLPLERKDLFFTENTPSMLPVPTPHPRLRRIFWCRPGTGPMAFR